MKTKLSMLVCLLLAIFVAVGCAPIKAPPKAEVPAGYETIRTVAVSVGGVGTTAIMAITAVLNKHYPEIGWSSCSGSSGPTAIYITKGTVKVGHTAVSSYIDAYGFDRIPESRLRSIIVHIPSLQYFFIIPEDKPWKDLTEVPNGVTLCPRTPGGTPVIASEAWLKLCGLSKKDFNWVPLGRDELAAAWRGGKVDMALLSVGGMAPYLMDMQSSPRKFKAFGLSPEQVAKAKAEQTFERLGFEAPAMSNVTELCPEIFRYDVMCPQQPMLLSCRDDFPENVAYKMAKVMDERHADLVRIFAPMKYATPQYHVRWARPPLDVHPGVARYYREKGYVK